MNETDILHTLDQACQGLNLIFQVVHDTETLYVYVNRPVEQSLQYETLTATIEGAIAQIKIPHLKNLYLYSRELGNVEPDWETFIALSSAASETMEHPSEAVLTEETATSPEPLETENLIANSEDDSTDLSHYCFTRNRSLLTSDILPPTESIALLLQRFDTLTQGDKLQALPLLDSFFRASSLPTLDDLNPDTQAWLHQLEQMNSSELRKTAIWLSRYCLNPAMAMDQIKVVLPFDQAASSTVVSELKPSLSLIEAKKQAQLSTPPDDSLEMYAAAAPVRLRAASEPQMMSPVASDSPRFPQETTRPRLLRYALLVPLIWLLCTATLIIIDVQAQKNPQVSEGLCQISGSPSYCQLAAQLLGDEPIQQFQKGNETAMAEEVMDRSVADCVRTASFNAGFTLKDHPEETLAEAVSNLQQETVFPGLLVVDLQHVGKTGGTVRTACVYRQRIDPVMLREQPSKLTSVILPNDWPTETFVNKTYRDTPKTPWNIPYILRHLGTNTLFTALGLLVAVYFSLGIRVDSLGTLYKSAFVLGISETLTSFIPIFGFFRLTVLEVLSLMLTTVVVKDLELEWSAGYRLVASGALTIIVIKTLLDWILVLSIGSLMA